MLVNRKEFIKELTWVNSFVEKKTTIPILKEVLFEAAGARLILVATDLEFAGRTTVRGQGDTDWTVTAPVADLLKYLAKVSEDQVSLHSTPAHQLVVTHGGAATKIQGMSRESYPELPSAPPAVAWLTNLPQAIERTAFAISPEESRFTLNGALLDIDEDEARLVATDGHRLSGTPVSLRCEKKLRVLIPKKTLLKLAKQEEECGLSVDDDHAYFDYGQHVITCRKLKGDFPDVKRVELEEFPNHALLPVGSTLSALERVINYADERSHAIRLTINEGQAVVYAESTEKGSATAEVQIHIGEGQGPIPFEVGYNGKYLIDFLKAAKDQFVAFCWQGHTYNALPDEDAPEGTPPAIAARGNASGKSAALMTGDGWYYTVMPMRI